MTERGKVDVRTDWTARIPRLWQFGRRIRYRQVPGTALTKSVLRAPAFEIIDHLTYFSSPT